MQRFLIVLAASLAVASASSSAVGGPPVRPAKDADAADHKFPASYLDWWRLHAVDPRTGRYLLIRIHTNSGPFLSAVVFDGHRWHGGVLLTDDPWEVAILQRVRRGWKLDLDGRYPASRDPRG
jgi:hypothetical protein